MSTEEHKQDSPDGPGSDVSRGKLANPQAHFAWLRTRMAQQTTLAAWIRTATSLITFGFAIVQFFEHLAPGHQLPRYIGLLLIAVGTVTTGVVLWEHQTILNYLTGETFQDIADVPEFRGKFPDIARFTAFVLCLIGLLAFFGIIAGVGMPAQTNP